MFHRQLQNLPESVYRVLTSDWITFKVPNMIVCSQHYANHIVRFFRAMEGVSDLAKITENAN